MKYHAPICKIVFLMILSLLVLKGRPLRTLPPDEKMKPNLQFLIKKEYQDGIAIVLLKQRNVEDGLKFTFVYSAFTVEKIGDFLRADKVHIMRTDTGNYAVLFLNAGKKPVLWSRDEMAHPPDVRVPPVTAGEPIRVFIEPVPYETTEIHLLKLEELYCQLITAGCGFRPTDMKQAQRRLITTFLTGEVEGILNHELPPGPSNTRDSAEKLSHRIHSD